MADLKLKYNTTGNDITLKPVGDTIQYYVSGHRYALLDNVYKKKKANGDIDAATLKDYFTALRSTSPKTDLYKIVENEYVLIESSETYDDNIYYYIIDGTADEKCYLCNGDGIITHTPEDTSSSKPAEDYPCPKCKGKGKLYHTTQAVSILGVTISQTALGPTGYSVRYKVVPYGETKSTIVNHEDLYGE